jgi:hypothetical protein
VAAGDLEFCSSKNSLSAWEVSRKYEVTNETAWHMIHRIREATKYQPVAGLLGGAVQVDEAWIGGEPKNRQQIAGEFAAHEYVNHSAGEYVRGNVLTDLNEGYFSQLKRSLDGTHHHVSVEHLQRYLHQSTSCIPTARATDSQRMRLVLSNVGGRGSPTSR